MVRTVSRCLRNVLIPVLKPVLVITTTLSAIWDFNVFNQIYAVRNAQPEQSYWTIGVYAYEKAFGESDYNTGATISLSHHDPAAVRHGVLRPADDQDRGG